MMSHKMRQLDSPDPEEQELDTDIRSIRAESPSIPSQI